MTANEMITALTTPISGHFGCKYQYPNWVGMAAITVCPRRAKPGCVAHYYQSTQVNFFTEVTVRIPALKTARRSGKQYKGLQRRRMDLVAVIQANRFEYQPIVAGIEIKVNEYDLVNDNKIKDYLPYCNLYYLAVPAELEDAAIVKRNIIGYDKMGLLVVHPDHVDHAHPNPYTPSDSHLKEIYAELLIKPFRNQK